MDFTPKTEEQVQKDFEEAKSRFAPWPAGRYRFEITNAEDDVTKKPDKEGKTYPMIVLTMNVYNNSGEVKIQKDWLLASMSYKLRHCAVACGLIDHYNAGKLPAYLFGNCKGELDLVIQKGKQKKDQQGNLIPGEFYGDSNAVSDYVINSVPAAPSPEPELDDEIPF